jgi:lipid II:glycine glycyltransferase (peptidoglycan interpeptide bridge formation enzyme)
MGADRARTLQLVAGYDHRPAWDAFVRANPWGHLFQTFAWGDLQSGMGGQPMRLAVVDGEAIAGALQLLVFDTGARVFTYVPRGPVCDPADAEVAELLVDGALVASHGIGAAFIRIEPQWTFDAALAEGAERRGFTPTRQSIMLPRTILVDIQPGMDVVWSRFRSNTRNRIRLAEKLGVTVRAGGAGDVASFVRLAEETAARHRLRRDSRQYELAWQYFGDSGDLRLLLASAGGADLAGVMVFSCGVNATYLWGASSGSADARRFNPNQLLHWTAMHWARARGCTTYDLHGIPDHDEPVLEAEYSGRDDGAWNLYRFKRGFGGRVHRHLGTFDWVFRA